MPHENLPALHVDHTAAILPPKGCIHNVFPDPSSDTTWCDPVFSASPVFGGTSTCTAAQTCPSNIASDVTFPSILPPRTGSALPLTIQLVGSRGSHKGTTCHSLLSGSTAAVRQTSDGSCHRCSHHHPCFQTNTVAVRSCSGAREYVSAHRGGCQNSLQLSRTLYPGQNQAVRYHHKAKRVGRRRRTQRRTPLATGRTLHQSSNCEFQTRPPSHHSCGVTVLSRRILQSATCPHPPHALYRSHD